MQNQATRLQELINNLAEPFVGRREESLLLVMGVITKEHVLLIGEPGTGKSALARRLASLIDAKYFKYLLTKFTEPSELLGPIDINALKEGRYKRITRGKLPEAEIAFLDEIFNANSAVLNSLLSVMQERIVYDGYGEIKTNIWTIIGASNTTPTEPELEALYDRFLYRHIVNPLDSEYWDTLLDKAWLIEKNGYTSPTTLISIKELEEYSKKIYDINVQPIKNKLIKLYLALEEKGLHITDRRKGKILKAIAAHALIHGRKTATMDDLYVLKYTVPRDPEEFEKIKIILFEELKTSERVLREFEDLQASLETMATEINKLQSFDPRLIDYYRTLKSLKEKVKALASDIEDEKVITSATELLEEIDNLINLVMMKLNM